MSDLPPSSPANNPTPPDPEDAFQTKAGLPQYYFEAERGRFWLKNDTGEWVNLNETGFKRHLKKMGLRDKPTAADVAAGKPISPIDDAVRDVEQNRRLDFAGELAGYRAGLHIITGQRVLVPRAADIIEPVRGHWPTLEKLFRGVFVGEEPSGEDGNSTMVVDQLDRWYGWHQHLMQCYMGGIISPGLALCIAGEADSGKTRISMILNWCLGGRVAKPYDYMIGRDNFNRELYSAVLQLVDDENADTRIDARLKFGSQIKKIVANDESKMRGMHRDGLNLAVLWRLLILVNLEANRLMVMPPIDADIRDKLLMLKGYRRPLPAKPITLETPPEEACWPMPMPTRTEDERRRFRDVLRAELPAYLWWLLNEYKMPSLVSGGRFCVRHWQHPQILERLQRFSPHVRIWQLIESSRVIFFDYRPGDAVTGASRDPRDEWSGTTRELHTLLKSNGSELTVDEKKSVPDPAWLGQRLEDVKQHFGDEVAFSRHTSKGTVWRLRKKAGLVD